MTLSGMYVKVAAALVLVAILFYSGWVVRGWKESKKLSALELKAAQVEFALTSNLNACLATGASRESALLLCKESQAKMIGEAKVALDKRKELERLHSVEMAAWEAKVADLQGTPLPSDCDEAVKELARRLSGAEKP
jgi:hypothetical protein